MSASARSTSSWIDCITEFLSGNYKCNNMALPRVLEPEVMSTAEEAGEYDEMDFSATDQLFAERAAQLVRSASVRINLIADLGSGNAKIPLAMCSLLPSTTRVCAV